MIISFDRLTGRGGGVGGGGEIKLLGGGGEEEEVKLNCWGGLAEKIAVEFFEVSKRCVDLATDVESNLLSIHVNFEDGGIISKH